MFKERIVVAEILRPRGIRGELLARSQTDIPGRLESLGKAHVLLPNGEDLPIEIEQAWSHKESWILKFLGVDSIESADTYRGGDLWVSRADRGKLKDGEFFQSDLQGCEVFDSRTGNLVGVVEGWQEYGGPPLMEVAIGGRVAMIPFIAAECQVNLSERTIRVNLPEGLLEL